MEKVVDEYVNEHFPVAGSTVICKDDQIIVLISGMKFNKSSFLNSQWKSTVRISAKDLKIAGDTTIKVHYFEEGNVYLEVQDSFQTGKYQNATIVMSSHFRTTLSAFCGKHSKRKTRKYK